MLLYFISTILSIYYLYEDLYKEDPVIIIVDLATLLSRRYKNLKAVDYQRTRISSNNMRHANSWMMHRRLTPYNPRGCPLYGRHVSGQRAVISLNQFYYFEGTISIHEARALRMYAGNRYRCHRLIINHAFGPCERR